jgi:hypothetical protein
MSQRLIVRRQAAAEDNAAADEHPIEKSLFAHIPFIPPFPLCAACNRLSVLLAWF